MKKRILAIMIILNLLWICPAMAIDLSTRLMQNTFKIEGQAKELGKKTYGTAFLIGREIKKHSGKGVAILVTANHVLDDIASNTAIIYFRKKIQMAAT